MNRILLKASGCAREGIARDDRAYRQISSELSDAENLVKHFWALQPGVQARFILERAPFPGRPAFPFAPDGISGQ